MSRFLSLHALHAVPASLLNRDDMGATKTIPFGGTTRVRVASQSWKRAMRLWLRESTIDGGGFGLRTGRLPHLTADVLATEYARDRDVAPVKVAAVFAALGLKQDQKTGDTRVLTFVSDDAPAALAAAVDKHWDAISDDGAPTEAVQAAAAAFDPGNAVDIALFGRFLAELPDRGRIDGAAEVAHPFSVDAARITPDFFTAVDDATTTGEPASANLGVVDVSAPVLYRHAALNRDQLTGNLADTGLVEATQEAFVDAFINSVPAAKRGSTAATTLPAFVLGITSDRDTSLADAFAAAVTSDDVLNAATGRLIDHAGRVLPFLPAATATLLPVTADPSTIPDDPGITTVATPEQFTKALAR